MPEVVVYRDRMQLAWPQQDWQAMDWNGEPSLVGANAAAWSCDRHAGRQSGVDRPPQPASTGGCAVDSRDRIALSGRSGHVDQNVVMQNAGIPPWQRQHVAAIDLRQRIVSRR